MNPIKVPGPNDPAAARLAASHAKAVLALSVLLLTSWFAAAAFGSGTGDPAPSPAPSPLPHHLWLEIRDAKGRPGSELASTDFTVEVSGQPQTVTPTPLQTLATSGVPAHFVLYFDPLLAQSSTLRRAGESLAALAQPLTALGDVELVVADPLPETLLTSRDPLVLGERLSRTALTLKGQNRLLELRSTTLNDLSRTTTSQPGPPETQPEAQAKQVAASIQEELGFVRERLDELLAWAADHTSERPQFLILVCDGFDLDPLAFYAQQVPEGTLRAIARSLAAPQSGPLGEVLAQEAAHNLAALGWTVLPLALRGDDAQPSVGLLETTDPQGEKSTGAGFTLRPGRRQRETEAAGHKHQLVQPEEPLNLLATASGGETLRTDQGLRDAVTRLGQRVELTYRPASPAHFDLQPVAIRSTRSELTVRGPQWTSSGPPPAIARLRAARVLAGREPEEGLAVVAALRTAPSTLGQSELEARWELQDLQDREVAADVDATVDADAADLDPADPAAHAATASPESDAEEDLDSGAEPELDRADDSAAETVRESDAPSSGESSPASPASQSPEERTSPKTSDLRVTLAAVTPQGMQELRQDLFLRTDLSQLTSWPYRAALNLPAGVEQVAVLIEDLTTGRWGGSLAAVVQQAPDLLTDSALPAPAVIEIQRPATELLRGKVRFATEVYDPAVRRVVFLLDEQVVATVERPPFGARLDLGQTPRRQELTAVAYSAAGAELGRHSVILNGGRSGLTIKIARPESGRGTGWVEVAADVAVPLEAQLDRVLFFWNAEPVATLYRPPFVQRVLIPSEQPTGYVRVVAMLADGTMAEDVLFMNGPAASERVDVNLVELYTVVTDRSGRPVRGLARDDFQVREDGAVQAVETFSDASDLPLTLGLAIDSSASMFVKLPRVQQAAIHFLKSTFKDEDRAFLVDFDSQPRLARGTTRELDRLVQAIEGLEADGRTALWESVVYSLVQLQGTSGRKALIVFSDGADEDDQFPFRSCLNVARRMGVPIYLILMRHAPKDSALTLFLRSFTSRVDRLVESTGGRVFYAREYRDLSEVYGEIEQELRSQYLLTYYPQNKTAKGWRDVTIEVTKKGLKPRTLAGYWQ